MKGTTLGQELKRLRTEADLTLRALATRVGVTGAHLSDIEHDRRRPSDTLLRGVARELESVGAKYDDLKLMDTGLDPATREYIREKPGVNELLREMRDSGRSPLDLLRELQKDRDEKRGKEKG